MKPPPLRTALVIVLALAALCSFAPAAPAQSPGEGPGGPILVVANDGENRFGRYYAELLRAEGLNEFAVEGVGALNAQTLAGYQVVLLAETTLSAGQASVLERLGERRRQPDRDAAGRGSRRPARDRRNRGHALRRLPEGGRLAGAGRRHRHGHHPVPRHGRPLCAQRRHERRDAVLRRDHGHGGARRDAAQRRRGRRAGRGVHLRSRPLGRLHAPGQSRLGRHRARRHRPGPLRRPLLRRRARTTGSTSARCTSRRPTSSSGCWRT